MIVRNRYFFLADIFLVAIAAMLSFAIRLDTFVLKRIFLRDCLMYVAVAVVTKPAVFYAWGLYRRLWRYASTRELLLVTSGALVSTTVAWGVALLIGLPLDMIAWIPRSVPLIDFLLSLSLVGGIRFAQRIVAETTYRVSGRVARLKQPAETCRRVLIVGAGDAGAMIAREMRSNPGLGIEPVGFVDDDSDKKGMLIHNIAVLGARDDIPRIVTENAVDEVIIAMPTVPGQTIREIKAICQGVPVEFKTIPGMYELISGTVSVNQIREIQIEDLLRREPVHTDITAIKGLVEGCCVLVTGAGGSIGSEICRQVARHRPQELIMLGHGENSLFRMGLELAHRFPDLKFRQIIGDIRDRHRMRWVFEEFKPSTVFHAAAHKHVPLMEFNRPEAITNNVLGTQTLLQLATRYDTDRFVLISSDKAVNPINMMGASKRLAELLVQDAAARTSRCFVAVRFGNVLGSRGSVVPLLQEQIANGGPVTITDSEMYRYFMTIPEAVQLVLQAVTLGRGGEVFVLDMGEPVRVLDLALDLIELSGLEPYTDIEIEFIGARPGEKLSEKLFVDGENYHTTRHEKIFVAYNTIPPDFNRLRKGVVELKRLSEQTEDDAIIAKLQEIIPNFKPKLPDTGLTTGKEVAVTRSPLLDTDTPRSATSQA
jgi:FlaA1/EpsC-like NDP-sugar epimerase